MSDNLWRADFQHWCLGPCPPTAAESLPSGSRSLWKPLLGSALRCSSRRRLGAPRPAPHSQLSPWPGSLQRPGLTRALTRGEGASAGAGEGSGAGAEPRSWACGRARADGGRSSGPRRPGGGAGAAPPPRARGPRPPSARKVPVFSAQSPSPARPSPPRAQGGGRFGAEAVRGRGDAEPLLLLSRAHGARCVAAARPSHGERAGARAGGEGGGRGDRAEAAAEAAAREGQ